MTRLYVITLLFFFLSGHGLAQKNKYDKIIDLMAQELAEDLVSMEIKKVAISNIFDEHGSTNKLTFLMEEDLTVSLLNLRKGLEIMDRNHLEEVLTEHHLAVGGLMNEETAIELGKLESVEAVITGTVMSVGDEFLINLKAMSTESGMIVSARKYEMKGNSQLSKLFETEFHPSQIFESNSNLGTIKLTNKSKKRKEIVIIYNEAKNSSQRDFHRTVILKRGESILLEDIPVGNLQFNGFKHKKRRSFFGMINQSLFGRTTIAMVSANVVGGKTIEVEI